jgi:hypothetical protein
LSEKQLAGFAALVLVSRSKAPEAARIVFVCRMTNDPASISSTISARFTMNEAWRNSELKKGNFCYEKVHHSCFGALCSGGDAGFLRERIPDNQHDDASDHYDHGTTAQTYAAYRLPRQ